MTDDEQTPAQPTADEVNARARWIYEKKAAEKQAAADATAHERQKDRDGNPIPHKLAPWAAVKSPFRELWLETARKQLCAERGLDDAV